MRERSRPTLADVARAAGVSKTAASYALNGRGGVSADTRQRVEAIARELNWQPSVRGRALAHSRSFAVGLVLSRPARLLAVDPFFATFVAGLEEVLAAHDDALVLRVVRDEQQEAVAYERLAGSGAVDGFVVTDLRAHDPRLPLLDRLQAPAVVLGEQQTGDGHCSWITLDDRTGVCEAARHLLALGHQRVAHVAGPSMFLHAASRERALCDTLARAGLGPCDTEPGDFTPEGGAAATKRLLDRPAPPTAIVYGNDLMALAGVGVLREAGLEVPADVSVVGFDDAPLAAHTHPPLSTVRADVLSWGATAAVELLRLLDGASPRSRALPPAELVLRASTAPAPPDHVRTVQTGAGRM